MVLPSWAMLRSELLWSTCLEKGNCGDQNIAYKRQHVFIKTIDMVVWGLMLGTQKKIKTRNQLVYSTASP
jgi:hypothetical protein